MPVRRHGLVVDSKTVVPTRVQRAETAKPLGLRRPAQEEAEFSPRITCRQLAVTLRTMSLVGLSTVAVSSDVAGLANLGATSEISS